MAVHPNLLRRQLLWVAIGAILLVCGVLVDAAEKEKVSHISRENKRVDQLRTLRDIVDSAYLNSESASVSASTSEDVVSDDEEGDPFLVMRLLKKDKKGSKSKAAKQRRRGPGTRVKNPGAARSKGGKAARKAPNTYINVRK